MVGTVGKWGKQGAQKKGTNGREENAGPLRQAQGRLSISLHPSFLSIINLKRIQSSPISLKHPEQVRASLIQSAKPTGNAYRNPQGSR